MRSPFLLGLALTLLPLLAVAGPIDPGKLPPAARRKVAFKQDIQPILTRSCYRCHGPKRQRSSFRLDLREAALKGGDLGRDILPGKSADSPLIHHVAGLTDSVMPPSGKRLTAKEIGLLRAWIDQGVDWTGDTTATQEKAVWWSLRPLTRPALPRLLPEDRSWVRNPIDVFILATLRARGLSPSLEADRRTLIRRLSFDLLGLPPAPEAVDAFVADGSPDAYERLVDRLLGSPQYGERWARHWLDVVHYGETHGYDKDKPRPNAWPYRDYVIRAFNDDRPYARFAQEQVAGDVLFPGTPDGIEALGFIAAGPWDFIGHAEVPESKIDGKVARHLDRDDMVMSTMGTFNSLTVGCAQCHDHKFDPIRQEDYYSLQAVFAALDRAERAYDPDPAVARKRAELLAQLQALEEKQRSLDEKLKRLGGRELAELNRQIAAASQPARGAKRPEFGYHSRIEKVQDREKWVQVDLGRSVPIDRVIFTACHDDFNHIGAGFGFPVRFRIDISDDPEFKKGVRVLLDRTRADVPNPGLVPQSVPAGGQRARFVRVTATRLAPRLNDYILALAELEVLDAAGKNRALGARVTALDSIEAPPRWRRTNLVDGIVYTGTAGKPGDLARLKARREALVSRLLDAPGRQEQETLSRQRAEVRRDLAGLPAQRRVYAGTVYSGRGAFAGTGGNGGKPREIRVLVRGDVRRPGKVVGPGTVGAIKELPSRFDLPEGHSEGQRRAALARWLTDRKNPLTWRSIVNRVWLYHFGRGIVDTPNDFGRMGQLPSHPELLDWLAADFRDSGQSLKRLHRLIVTSATYRQASTPNPAGDRIDWSNAFYWRMNRRRLEAEAVRDAVLSVSGCLATRMGGPSFQDFVIEKPEHSPHYQYHLHDPEDPRCHRRSVYRFIVRSQQQPFMATLDCADPSLAVDKRNQTITPLQALAMLNNKLVLAMAKHFAARVEKEGNSLEARVRAAFRLALGRSPTAEEQSALTAYARQHGLANVCRVIFNLNEFVFVD
jgi:Protein of unknown function (DUF1553)/Protein of unknown function (DUF1549)/Planctomycete cytochrome C